MRFRWFIDPEYYANKTWEEQAADKAAMSHYSKSCTDPSVDITVIVYGG
jgi:hypothetical protein